MANTALYRAYRPEIFDDVVGQTHITKTLKNEVQTGQLGHAYLFCGGRGTGKTSTARILSRAVNCENPQGGNPCNECATCRGILSGEIMDVVEIDAASNNGVDNIRDLREEARFCAAACSVKVYIIDEVHMLSQGAFNALLKLLEEPPTGVIFILATTELHKVPATILSRCQRFDFHRIGTRDISARLLSVADEENIKLDNDAAALIARAADGALRDALSILDQCRAGGERITADTVSSMLGTVQTTFLYQVARAISTDDAPRAIALLDEYIAKGQNAARFIETMVDYLRSLLMTQVLKEPRKDMTKAEYEELCLVAAEFSKQKLIRCINILIETMQDIKGIANTRVLVDVAVLKMCMPAFTDDFESIETRVAELERKIEHGVAVTYAAAEDEKPQSTPPARKPAAKKTVKAVPLTGDLKKIEEKWREICRSTDKLRLMIALERAKISSEGDSLVLLYSNTDRIMLDFLKDEQIMQTLTALIEKAVGFAPRIIVATEGEEKTEDAPAEDPLDTLDSDVQSEDDAADVFTRNAEIEAIGDEEDDEEYSFEEPEHEEE